jgi:allophanate hydrolase subunit 1
VPGGPGGSIACLTGVGGGGGIIVPREGAGGWRAVGTSLFLLDSIHRPSPHIYGDETT